MNGEEVISPSVLEREVCGGEGLSSEVMSVCLLGRAIFPKKGLATIKTKSFWC
jgi:hypothetical protein